MTYSIRTLNPKASGNAGSLVLRACPLLLRDLGVATMGFGGFSLSTTGVKIIAQIILWSI